MKPSRLDLALHAPARLQIAAVLARVDEAEFATIRDIVAVSDSVLSKHLSALGEEGYVRLRKAAQDGRQRTWASLTRTGRKAFAAHMAALQELVAHAQSAVATEQDSPGGALTMGSARLG
jgi:DNA-binding MarR family transcriptional regulator